MMTKIPNIGETGKAIGSTNFGPLHPEVSIYTHELFTCCLFYTFLIQGLVGR